MPTLEKEPVILTKEEYGKIIELGPENPEVIKIMQEKGISPDSGVIDIEIEGSKHKIETRSDDFGTMVREQTYGKEN